MPNLLAFALALAIPATPPQEPAPYCTRCLKEKRIEGPARPERLMERDGQDIRRSLDGDFTYIETAHTKLFTDLPAMNVKLDFDPKIKEELRQINQVLPYVTENTTTLNEHAVAHLFSNQIVRLYREFQELMGVDEETPYRAPHMGQQGKFEVYLFRRERVYEKFCDLFIGKKSATGQEHNNFSDDALSYVTFMGGDASTLRGFRAMINHKVSHIYFRGYRHYSTEVPAWLIEGHGHWRERLDQDKHDTFCFSEATLASGWETRKWKPKVRRLVESGKHTPLAELARKEQPGDLTADERGQSWSMVTFLIETDLEGFRKLVNGWKDHQRIPSYTGLQEELMQKALGLTLNQFTERWKEHVLKTYPKV